MCLIYCCILIMMPLCIEELKNATDFCLDCPTFLDSSIKLYNWIKLQVRESLQWELSYINWLNKKLKGRELFILHQGCWSWFVFLMGFWTNFWLAHHAYWLQNYSVGMGTMEGVVVVGLSMLLGRSINIVQQPHNSMVLSFGIILLDKLKALRLIISSTSKSLITNKQLNIKSSK